MINSTLVKAVILSENWNNQKNKANKEKQRERVRKAHPGSKGKTVMTELKTKNREEPKYIKTSAARCFTIDTVR